MKDDRFPRLVNLSMLTMESKNWASKIKDILNKYDLSEVWTSQNADNEREVLKVLRERLIEEYTQQWWSMLNTSPRYSLYRQLKVHSGTEKYLYVLNKKVFRDVVI